MIKYSIIIPTCSAELISMNLKYIEKLKQPKNEYEVIVIQNNDDNTIEKIVYSYKNKIPNLKFLKEENKGLLYTRHTGIRESEGEILCYLDDDSFVDKNWLVEIEKTFKNPNVLFAGGNNLPMYESKPSKWLKFFWINTNYGSYMAELSLINFYNKKIEIPTWFVFGCNFIIKKETLLKYKGFHPDVVPKDKLRYQGDGETAVSLKLNNDGQVAYFNPKIKIHHYVPNSRMTIEYFKKRGFYHGISDSFSQIRQKHGFTYFSFKPNENITNVKISPFLKGYNYLIKPIFNKLNKKLDKNYQIYLNVKEEYQKSYKEGFDFHQNEVKNDPELLKWVLKDSYIE